MAHVCTRANVTGALGQLQLPIAGAESEHSRSFEDALQDLQSQWRAAGLYSSDSLNVALDLALISLMLFASFRLSARYSTASGALFGLAVHQTLRHGHDFGHNAGLWRREDWSSPLLHDATGYGLVNLLLGVDVHRWTHDHQLHHRYTMSNRDPQIKNGDDYFPLFSRSAPHLAARIEQRPVEGLLLRWQEVSWLPLLVMAGKHSLWQYNWMRIGREQAGEFRHHAIRKAGLLGHYIFQWAVARRGKNWGAMARWFLACSFVAGWIEPQFLFNHYQTCAEPHGHADDHVAQVLHTVNYRCYGKLEEWLHVSLAHQIEHHLTPKIPSDHHATIAADGRSTISKYCISIADTTI